MNGRKEKMPGKGGVDGDIGGLIIADFTDKNDVGILTNDGSEGGSERVTSVFGDLGLDDSLERILDRILDGDDFRSGTIEGREERVERRRFSGSRRAGIEYHAVRLADLLHDLLICQSAETEIVDIDDDVVA